MAKFYQKNKLELGIGLGLLLPMILFGLLMLLYFLLDQSGLTGSYSFTETFRLRTMAVVSIASNIFLMRYYQRNRYWFDTLRGVTIATAGLSVIWMIYFLPGLLGG